MLRLLACIVIVSLLLTWCPLPASASKQPEGSPAKPMSVQAASEAVVKAFRVGDQARLKALARNENPDPWLVVEELRFRGSLHAAEAFAKETPRHADGLAAYAASRRSMERTSDLPRRFETARSALHSADWQGALDAFVGIPGALDPATGVRIASIRGLALRGLGQLPQSHAVLLQAAENARALGWLRRACRLYEQAHRSARENEDHQGALQASARWRETAEAIGNKGDLAKSLESIGNVQYESGQTLEALSTFERVLVLAREVDDQRLVARTLGNLGIAHQLRGAYSTALSLQQRALALERHLGLRGGMAETLGNIGNLHLLLHDYPKALSFQNHALAVFESVGHRKGVANTLSSLGAIQLRLGDNARARLLFGRALKLYEGLGDRRGMAVATGNLGTASFGLRDYLMARSFTERALALNKALGDRHGVATTTGRLGILYEVIGNYQEALACLERALALMEDLGDRRGVAAALGNIGNVYSLLGAYHEAFSFHERALALGEALSDQRLVASSLSNLGLVYGSVGDCSKAAALFERSLTLFQALGDRPGAAAALGNLGGSFRSCGDHVEALAVQERALTLMRAIGDQQGEADLLLNMGIAHAALHEYAEARDRLECALALFEELGDRAGVASALGDLGCVQAKLDDVPRALQYLARAVRMARRLRARDVLAAHLENLARVRLVTGEAGRALGTAQQALREVEDLFGMLAEEEGAGVREQYADLFAVGTLAAVRLEEPGEALTFLESGRAGALLEALGGRRSLEWTELPQELRELAADARAVEMRARGAYERALRTGKRREAWKARVGLDEATECVREAAARIQREAKKQAGLLYPRAAMLEEIQDWLEQDEALVLYGLCLDEAVALVLTHDADRLVALGAVSVIRAGCEALHLEKTDADAEATLEHLHTLLVEPLHLPKSVRTVLVSPEGALCYVPYGALFAVPVACTPSGTTHVHLMAEEHDPGQRVLALGDPDYRVTSDPGAREIFRRGVDLVPLPGTREEAETIGDLVLLGADANETKLRETLSMERRWRAVHLACHGLVDPERPTLSSLALTRTSEEDGFLTALEVLRMSIPTDLAVLSACESARGKVVRGEGIVGLTRCFMYAGAPRVLCSLWMVDDEATKALMVRFYELWNPRDGSEGLGAAVALKQAQAYVRDHPRHPEWRHPYYWAAWVLWGLPD